MKNSYIAFLFGVLSNLVDDVIDVGLFPRLRLPLQVLLLMFSGYVLYFNKSLSPVAAFTFGLGGIIACILAPDAVDAPIWKGIIAISLPALIYYSFQVPGYVSSLDSQSVNNLVYFVLPLFVFGVVFSVIENRLVPGEYSAIKLVDKSIQVVATGGFLLAIDYISRWLDLTKGVRDVLVWLSAGWFGNVTSRILGLLYWRYYVKADEVGRKSLRSDKPEACAAADKEKATTVEIAANG